MNTSSSSRRLSTKLLSAIVSSLLLLSALACGDDDTPDPDPGVEMCGGIAGFACSDPNDICIQDVGMCGVADASGTCQPQPQACTKEYAPVCGCDGKTYGNKCMANAAGASVDHEGACQPTTGQTCGTRGAAACPAGTVCIWDEAAACGATDKPGTCQVTPQFCTEQYDPVCGCDDQTYGNECEAHAAGVSVASKGACQPPQPEICGGFAGFTCDNPGDFCKYDLAAYCGFADATGTCQPKPQACTQQYDPVCGCDGKTYSNECVANAAGASIQSQGACPTTN